ncbi:MAG: hypothetical protein RLZZ28_114 [Bacteroidota bacterium]|jgi:putative redox protein
MKTTTKWVEGLAFDAEADSGHTVRIDTTVEGGGLGSGMNPKKILLGALNACSGMDVVDILRKMKVAFSKFEIEASAEQTEDHPKVFKFVHMVYRIDADAANMDKVKKAVDLSKDKYCGIAAMLSKHCEITYTIELFK